MYRYVYLLLALCTFLSTIRAAEESLRLESEKAQIEFLLKALASSELTFIRDGKEYNGKQAADHLRMKWQLAGKRIVTAQQFIELCGSKSGSDKGPYRVILPDEKEPISSAAWLSTTLNAYKFTLSLITMGEAGEPLKKKVDPERLKQLLADLGNEAFIVREKATVELIDLGSEIAGEVAKLEKETADPEIAQRCKKISNALKYPDQTALGVLRYIEKSDGRFFRPKGSRSNFDGPSFAAHLQAKALLFNFSLTRPAKEFVESIASRSSLRSTSYRIRLPNGTELDVKEWLGKRFKLE